MLRRGRGIAGLSAVLLPFDPAGDIDWRGLRALIDRTRSAGLTPAVNMDTGYANLLDERTRAGVLDLAAEVADGRFAAGAFVRDEPGDSFDAAAHAAAIAPILERGGTPVLFQSHGLASLPEDEIVGAYERITVGVPSWIAFELGEVFAPFGRVYSLETYAGLIGIGSCIGAKHSSLHRVPEWERLALRDELRPDFHVFTGNDLAIDMVRYGSDYLLGLSACCPDLFAQRDAWWRDSDPRVYELDDALQALGTFVFRDPVPAYKHDVAMFLALRGWIACDAPHPGAARRPESDRPVLKGLLERCLAAAATITS
jgi:dihydrodipicolinate synthase/N-acetylneuraminate lyase